MPVWFSAKLHGWGWEPSTWQGWLLLGPFVILIALDFQRIDATLHSASDTLIAWIPDTVALTLALIVICYRTGEKPRWRWGKQ